MNVKLIAGRQSNTIAVDVPRADASVRYLKTGKKRAKLWTDRIGNSNLNLFVVSGQYFITLFFIIYFFNYLKLFQYQEILPRTELNEERILSRSQISSDVFVNLY